MVKIMCKATNIRQALNRVIQFSLTIFLIIFPMSTIDNPTFIIICTLTFAKTLVNLSLITLASIKQIQPSTTHLIVPPRPTIDLPSTEVIEPISVSHPFLHLSDILPILKHQSLNFRQPLQVLLQLFSPLFIILPLLYYRIFLEEQILSRFGKARVCRVRLTFCLRQQLQLSKVFIIGQLQSMWKCSFKAYKLGQCDL